MKPIIVFDMDDTLCVLTDAAVKVVKEKLGTHISSTRLHHEWYGALHEHQVQTFTDHVYTEDFYLALRPKFDAQAMYTLFYTWNKLFEFQIVTHRSKPLGDKAESVTRNWLKKYSINSFFSTVTPLTFDTLKSSSCRDNTVMMLDDSLRVHQDFSTNKPDIKFCMVSNPWNEEQTKVFDRVTSVYCFNRIFKKLALELELV